MITIYNNPYTFVFNFKYIKQVHRYTTNTMIKLFNFKSSALGIWSNDRIVSIVLYKKAFLFPKKRN